MKERGQKSLHVDDPVAVGQRVKAAREQADLSQAMLAGDDCSAAYISRIELGDRTPSLQLLRELAKRLDVSADYLASGSVSVQPEQAPLISADLALRFDELEEARGLYEAVLETSSVIRDRSDALAGLGQIAIREGRGREGIELLERSVAVGRFDPVARPSIAEALARAYAEAGEAAQSVALLSRCVETYSSDHDLLLYIKFAAMLGYALTDAGDLAGAERVVAKALVAGRDVSDPHARARLFWSRSRLLAMQGNPGAAERYARRTLETLRVTEDTYAIGHALETLAHIYLDLGRSVEALELLDEGAPLIEASATPPEIGRYRLEQARALAALGEIEKAKAIATEVAGGLTEVLPMSRGRAYLLLAELFRDLDDVTRSQEMYESAIACVESQQPSRYLTAAYRGLAEIHKQEGRRDEALELLERALNVHERTGIA
ncbi:MAG TPA: tetratricopeptide repeat protein [Gaiellaceae bacterium]